MSGGVVVESGERKGDGLTGGQSEDGQDQQSHDHMPDPI